MAGQSPALPDGATPVLVGRILTAGHLKLHHPSLSLQLHRTTAPMPHLCFAQGGKRRHARRPPPAIVAEVSFSSTRVLPPSLPARSLSTCGVAHAQCSCVSFGGSPIFCPCRRRFISRLPRRTWRPRWISTAGFSASCPGGNDAGSCLNISSRLAAR